MITAQIYNLNLTERIYTDFIAIYITETVAKNYTIPINFVILLLTILKVCLILHFFWKIIVKPIKQMADLAESISNEKDTTGFAGIATNSSGSKY